jgi:Flp pilus assembly pilin Flp
MLTAFTREESGAITSEYGLIAVAIAGAVVSLGTELGNTFQGVSDTVRSAARQQRQQTGGCTKAIAFLIVSTLAAAGAAALVLKIISSANGLPGPAHSTAGSPWTASCPTCSPSPSPRWCPCPASRPSS